VFGIKNARSSAGQDKLVFSGGIGQAIARSPTSGLLNRDISFCNNTFQLSLSFYSDILGTLATRNQKSVQMIGGNGCVRAEDFDAAFKVRTMLVVGISQAGGRDCNRGDAAVLVDLDKNR